MSLHDRVRLPRISADVVGCRKSRWRNNLTLESLPILHPLRSRLVLLARFFPLPVSSYLERILGKRLLSRFTSISTANLYQTRVNSEAEENFVTRRLPCQGERRTNYEEMCPHAGLTKPVNRYNLWWSRCHGQLTTPFVFVEN